jgi:hypothetical protein
MQNLIQLTHYIPIVTTIISFAFTVVLFRHWRRKPEAAYLMWWCIGAFLFGIGTLTEAYTGLFGWNNFILKAWYISGALMGGAPLAQGTVYLLFKKKTADIMAACLVVYTVIASFCVALAPINAAADHFNLTGRGTFEWAWVRAFSPFSNTYALIFLVGGAAWSAFQYARKQGTGNRMWGNIWIAVGALLPGIGGSFTRFGFTEALYVTEFIGILLIWLGYRLMTAVEAPSIHPAQQAAPTN